MLTISNNNYFNHIIFLALINSTYAQLVGDICFAPILGILLTHSCLLTLPTNLGTVGFQGHLDCNEFLTISHVQGYKCFNLKYILGSSMALFGIGRQLYRFFTFRPNICYICKKYLSKIAFFPIDGGLGGGGQREGNMVEKGIQGDSNLVSGL